MADIDSGLPVSRGRQLNALTFPIFVAISDGTTQASVTTNNNLRIAIAEQTLTAVAISRNQTANAETNPVYVAVVDAASGDEVQDYNTSASVASGGTSTHTYTAAGTGAFIWRKALIAASGAQKCVFKRNAITFAVGFTSIANPNLEYTFVPAVEVPATQAAAIDRINREALAMDVYSTIFGSQL